MSEESDSDEFTLLIVYESDDVGGAEFFSISSRDLSVQEIAEVNKVSQKSQGQGAIDNGDELLWDLMFPDIEDPESEFRLERIRGGMLLKGPVRVLYCMPYCY